MYHGYSTLTVIYSYLQSIILVRAELLEKKVKEDERGNWKGESLE